MNADPTMYANPRKTKSTRRLGRVDISALKAAALAIPEAVWQAENEEKPNTYGALVQASHIMFRFVRDIDDWRQSDDMDLWREWRSLIEPVMEAAVAPYGYRSGGYPRIMFARLPAGGVILPHKDGNPAAKWPHKIHVPLYTNEETTFFIQGVGYHLPEGEAVEVNNMDVHAVNNAGATDRLHLIFEYYDRDQPPPEWARPMALAKQDW